METAGQPKSKIVTIIKERVNTLFGRTPKPEGLTAPPSDLNHFLVRTYKGEAPSPEDFPGGFNLGEIGKEGERLIKDTLSDPAHREYMSRFVVNMGGKTFFISSIKGDEGSVSAPPSISGESDLLVIHTHPMDTPFSPVDVDSLFVQTNWKGQPLPAEMVVTPALKILILRTSKTPRLETNTWWDPKMEMYKEPAMDEEVFDLPKGHLEPLGRLAPISNKRMYALTRIAQKYQLKIYTCSIDNNVAKLAN